MNVTYIDCITQERLPILQLDVKFAYKKEDLTIMVRGVGAPIINERVIDCIMFCNPFGDL